MRSDAPRPLALPRRTHRLEGPSAERYKAAAAALGAPLEGDVFDVDRAGVCPELASALSRTRGRGPRGAAVWILTSLEQGTALHTSERFSFEGHLLDRLYDAASAFIERVTATEPLLGTVELTPSAAASLEELGSMEQVKVELTTPSGSLAKLTELLAMDGELDRPENYLSREYLLKMVALAREVSTVFGSVQELRLPKLHHELGAFCAPALGGVYYFPHEPQDLLIHPPPYKKPELEETYRGLALPVKLSSPHLTQRLQEMGLLRFSSELVPKRLEELEDEGLLAAGIEPSCLSSAERGPAVASRRAALPRTWHELNALSSLLRRKEGLPDARLVQLSEEARVKLAEPVRELAVVGRLLSDLDHIDYPRFYRFNRVRFATHFADYSELKKRHVWQRICREQPAAVPEPEPEDSEDAGPADEPPAVPEDGDITFIEK